MVRMPVRYSYGIVAPPLVVTEMTTQLSLYAFSAYAISSLLPVTHLSSRTHTGFCPLGQKFTFLLLRQEK